ncbi:MAG: molybdopterin-guanine dinucleotide biosynthesis protein MobB [Saprospiraceae bacterium]|jgi:molybdopterin-guanine dinucleotide biosynthesis protein MobB
MIDFPIPVLGLCAFSGTGKTTLLAKVLPLLNERGLRVGVVKHAHHQFEIDHEGRDSYLLRKAGASQIAIASQTRRAYIEELPSEEKQPELSDALALLKPGNIDLVISEGFKLAPIPKIELHRAGQGNPLMCEQDLHIFAIAVDEKLPLSRNIPQLDLNDVESFTQFIVDWFDSVSKLRAKGAELNQP